ncbi:capZ-interacting protein [Rhynchonycteris naso]
MSTGKGSPQLTDRGHSYLLGPALQPGQPGKPGRSPAGCPAATSRPPTCPAPQQPQPDQAGSEDSGTVSPGGGVQWHLEDMEERPAETNANVDNSAPPSVAQLAGRFREQAAAAKEMPASKPARRKPPCSLPLFPPKVELGQNGEEKSPPNASHLPKVKVKSSPLIEKLQANLAFDPAALLPGASPKSPGLKATVSPFHSPPSTPSSPGMWPQRGKSEEVPISFDQPPEGSHLPCYNKVRTRGSIKRRPPSRRFRRSQSDCGELGDLRAAELSQENGAQEEAGDEVFLSKSKAPGPPPPGEGEGGRDGRMALESHEKPPLRRTHSRTEKQEEKARAPEEALQPEKPVPDAQGEAAQPAQAPHTEAENGCGSPEEEKPHDEPQAEASAMKEERAAGEEELPRQSQDTEGPVGQGTLHSTPAEAEGSLTPEEGKGHGKQEEGTVPEPGCNPGTCGEVPKTEIGPVHGHKGAGLRQAVTDAEETGGQEEREACLMLSWASC